MFALHKRTILGIQHVYLLQHWNQFFIQLNIAYYKSSPFTFAIQFGSQTALNNYNNIFYNHNTRSKLNFQFQAELSKDI